MVTRADIYKGVLRTFSIFRRKNQLNYEKNSDSSHRLMVITSCQYLMELCTQLQYLQPK